MSRFHRGVGTSDVFFFVGGSSGGLSRSLRSLVRGGPGGLWRGLSLPRLAAPSALTTTSMSMRAVVGWIVAQVAAWGHHLSARCDGAADALSLHHERVATRGLARLSTKEPSEMKLLSEVAEDAARGAISRVLIGVERLDVKLTNGDRYSAMLVPWLDLRWLVETLAKHRSAFGLLDESSSVPAAHGLSAAAAAAASSSSSSSRTSVRSTVAKVIALVAPFAYLALAYKVITRAQSGPRDASVGRRYVKKKVKASSSSARTAASSSSAYYARDGGEGGGGPPTAADAVVGFASVAGVDAAKRELEEVVAALRHPEKFAKVGAKCPRGVLLTGPSGTGKTLLAMACAAEADVPFLSCSASAFVELLVGRGAARVRELFDRARKCAPCIVFIDEIDAVAKSRGLLGHSDEREQTLNQILCELDGFDSKLTALESDGTSKPKPVVLLAATNRPNVLDSALTRPGRLDRAVVVPLPDRAGRRAILGVHARGVALGEDVDLETIAARSERFSGADLANVVNEAALLAVRQRDDRVRQAHLVAAIQKRRDAHKLTGV